MSTMTAPSRSAAGPSSSSTHASSSVYSSTTPASCDVKACLEILRKLAPKLSPDLPSLPSDSSHSAPRPDGQQRTAKRRSDEGAPEERPAAKRSKTTVTGSLRASSSEEEEKQHSSLPGKKQEHTEPTVASKKDPAAQHKRSGSTSSVISLSQLKARTASNNKAKMNKPDDDGNTSSSSIAFASRKPIPPPKQTQASSLSNSPPQPTAITLMSPTLPSPAPTTSSNKDPGNSPPSAQNGFASAPSPDTPALSTSNGKETVWNREQFKKIAAICKAKGRALKHSGDRRMREYSSGLSPSASTTTTNSSAAANRHLTPIIALFEQVDAVILYAYAFWCEDQAAGQLRNTQASSAASASSSTMAAAAPATASNLSTSTSSDNSATLASSSFASVANNATSSGGNDAGGGTSSTIGGNAAVSSSATSFSKSWKAGCIAENWKSIFGLVAFIRGRAEKLGSTQLNPNKVGSRVVDGIPRAMEIVVAWMNMLEALILQHLTTNASRNLNAQASKMLSATSPGGLASSIGGATGSANDLSPPSGNGNESPISSPSTSHTCSSNPRETNDFLQKFLKLQSDLEKIHTLWPTSQNILLHPELSSLSSASQQVSSNDLASSGYGGRSRNKNNGPSSGSGMKDEEDLLNLVLRKGRMAYDYEPTKLDDIVMPDLPRDDDAGEVSQEQREGQSNVEEADADADGEPDTSLPNSFSSHSIKRTTSFNNPTNGPKSPEDLFKDEENYYRFSWPIVIHHPNSIAHTTSFGRALLFEMSSRLGIEYTSPGIV